MGKLYLYDRKFLFKKIKIVAVSKLNLKKIFTSQNNKIYNLVKWNELIKYKELDGIIIATPPDSHFQIAKYYIKKNIKILDEKPVCLNYTQTKKLFNLTKKYKAVVLVNHIHLLSPAFIKLKQYLKKETVSKISSYGYGTGPIRDYSALLDWSPHDSSMIYSLIGFNNELKIRDVGVRRGSRNKSAWKVYLLLKKQN